MSLIAAAVAANPTRPGTSPAAGQPLSTSRQGRGVPALPMPHLPQGLQPPLPARGRTGPRWHLVTRPAVHRHVCRQLSVVFASGDTRGGDRFGVSVEEAPACARVVRACQVAGAGWGQEGSVCVVPCAVLRAHSSPREAPALLQCLHPKVSGSLGAGPQNCSGDGTGVGCQLAQGSRGHRAFLAGEGDEQDPQCTLWLLVSMPDPACKGGCSSCIQHCCNGCGGGELGPGGSRACAQGPASPTVLAAVELSHGLGSCLARGPGQTGPRTVWTESPRVLPGSCVAAASSRCAESVCGWEGSALRARQSRPRLHPHPCASCSGSVRCALPAAAARRCLALLGSVCAAGASVCPAVLCGAVPDCPLCSQEAG